MLSPVVFQPVYVLSRKEVKLDFLFENPSQGVQYVEVTPALWYLHLNLLSVVTAPVSTSTCVTSEPLYGSVAFSVHVQKGSDCKSFYGSVPFNLRKVWLQFFYWMSFSFYTKKMGEKQSTCPAVKIFFSEILIFFFRQSSSEVFRAWI